jgi:hypothetical protein
MSRRWVELEQLPLASTMTSSLAPRREMAAQLLLLPDLLHAELRTLLRRTGLTGQLSVKKCARTLAAPWLCSPANDNPAHLG